MTSKRGYSPRKKRPANVIKEEPPLVVNCLCPHCNASFMHDQIKGCYLHRTCPKCDEEISTRDYDAKAKACLAERGKLSDQIGEHNKRVEKYDKAIGWSTRWHLRPIRAIFERLRTGKSTAKESCESRFTALGKQLSSIANMRYYTSEPFIRTHTPLERKVVNPFHMRPYYDQEGNWRLKQTSAEEAGLAAEIFITQKLFEKAADPASPLFKAQVLPNIYVPKDRNSNESSHWAQIDCVLLTRQCALVIETKRHSAHIVVPIELHGVEIFSTRSGDMIEAFRKQYGPWTSQTLEELGLETKESIALSQSEYHASLFSDVCPEYPYEEVFEQIVYARPKSFFNPINGFTDNLNISCANYDTQPCIEAIEGLCEMLPEAISQDKLDELGERILNQYGDLNQKRGLLHEMILERQKR